MPIRKRRILSDDEYPVDDESLESCSTICTLMPKMKTTTVKKELDDTFPLPYPFPIPKYYPCNVELALKSKQMTQEMTSKFISCVARAMLNYKCYPMSQDCNNVAQTVVDKYPQLISPTGSPHESLLRHVGTHLNLCIGGHCTHTRKQV